MRNATRPDEAGPIYCQGLLSMADSAPTETCIDCVSRAQCSNCFIQTVLLILTLLSYYVALGGAHEHAVQLPALLSEGVQKLWQLGFCVP